LTNVIHLIKKIYKKKNIKLKNLNLKMRKRKGVAQTNPVLAIRGGSRLVWLGDG
jgi:hypothetical protein